MKRIQYIPSLPARCREGHKGDYGRVLVLAGSRGMVGAAVLAGNAALRSGAGLVTVGTPAGVYPMLAAQVTCCMTRAFPETRAGTLSGRGAEEILSFADGFDAVALGPGLGRHAATTRLVNRLVRKVSRPLVLDADGLNALAEDTAALRCAAGPRILTPHPGEMARLAGLRSASAVQENRRGIAARFAAAYGVVLLLKGYRTLVTDGKRLFVNGTGNPGMATGGTGDVLTGAIAALLAQGMPPFEAAQLGAYVHGVAGDIAAAEFGEVSLVATDVLDALPAAFKKVHPGIRKRKAQR